MLRKGKFLDTVEKRKVNMQDHFSERKHNTEQEKRKNVQKGGKSIQDHFHERKKF